MHCCCELQVQDGRGHDLRRSTSRLFSRRKPSARGIEIPAGWLELTRREQRSDLDEFSKWWVIIKGDDARERSFADAYERGDEVEWWKRENPPPAQSPVRGLPTVVHARAPSEEREARAPGLEGGMPKPELQQIRVEVSGQQARDSGGGETSAGSAPAVSHARRGGRGCRSRRVARRWAKHVISRSSALAQLSERDRSAIIERVKRENPEFDAATSEGSRRIAAISESEARWLRGGSYEWGHLDWLDL
jgi:hypothetical protein